MMKQYVRLKKRYSDCLLFFRLGDFYELFMDDAKIGAQVLNITLTGRDRGKDGRIPMAGVPYHSVDPYIAKLVKAGYKVAISEQLGDPTQPGLVERDVVRVITPGTLVDEKALEKKENNFIVSIVVGDGVFGLSAADVSTGAFYAFEAEFAEFAPAVLNELFRFNPSECILSQKDYENPQTLSALKSLPNMNVFCFRDWSYRDSRELKEHFSAASLVGFGVEDESAAALAAAALIAYLKQTQKEALLHINSVKSNVSDDFVLMDGSTVSNLELFSTIRDRAKKGTLTDALDFTSTAMGGRLLRLWLLRPLRKKTEIEKRLDAVAYLIGHRLIAVSLDGKLKEVGDIERIVSRLAVGVGNAKDLVALKFSLSKALEVKEAVEDGDRAARVLKTLAKEIAPDLEKTIRHIDNTIVDEPPFELKEGGLIKSGVDANLDDLKKSILDSKNWLVELEALERSRTGIASLKVRFNKIYGFYIEVTKANLAQIPANYIRKQTMVNAERYITPELKEKEDLVLRAEDEISKLEFEIFTKTVKTVLQSVGIMQAAASSVAALDCLLSFSLVSQKFGYHRPVITTNGIIIIKDGRHPVVEQVLKDKQFVPNGVVLDRGNNTLLVVTGPNMAGKSVYIRQVALLVLMAHAGCFVPARSASICTIDRLFVRSGASDVISAGLSTFMVEMTETAYILNNCTKDSLVVMDEIGRGTSTYDGISLAWAIAEYLAKTVGAKTLFATHYHELQELENEFANKIKNFHMAVTQSAHTLVFLYKVARGGASHSFGVAVAKLAGVPDVVTQKAFEILTKLEGQP